jgi:hypothetical protein
MHTPYLASNLHKSYTQKLTYIPIHPTSKAPLQKRNTKLNIYLVANEKALSIVDQPIILHILQEALTKLVGTKPPHISLTLSMEDPQHIDSGQSYTNPYPKINPQTLNHRRYPIRQF